MELNDYYRESLIDSLLKVEAKIGTSEKVIAGAKQQEFKDYCYASLYLLQAERDLIKECLTKNELIYK